VIIVKKIFLACGKLGAYATLLNYAYSAAELHSTIAATTPKVLITTLTTSRYDYTTTLNELSSHLSCIESIVILPDISGEVDQQGRNHGFLTYCGLYDLGSSSTFDLAQAENAVKPEDIINLQFTSGSTGRPKAAALTHRGILNSARYIGQQMKIHPNDRILVPVPLFHAFGLIIGEATPSPGLTPALTIV
jgi:mevalonyl-CoA ligase